MIPALLHSRCVLLHGDSSKIATILQPNSVDALVCDPPSGIGFMDREWDGDRGGRSQWIAWLAEILRAAFIVLKPGAYCLIWALPRTSHWTATAIEDAGFELRDRVSHLFGNGFPKSLTSKSAAIPEWSGTALKPACEDWWLARKPPDGTVADNLARYGTGVLNIAGCRVSTAGEVFTAPQSDPAHRVVGPESTAAPASGDAERMQAAQRESTERLAELGRWPANVMLSHAPECVEVGAAWACVLGCAVRALDDSGPKSKPKKARKGKHAASESIGTFQTHDRITSEPACAGGGVSRFFYCAKPSRSERETGLDHLAPRSGGEATDRDDGSAGLRSPRAGAGRTGGARNFHPTVKSIELMRRLCRLITPPGGTVLDLFAGSGTTGVAALAEGFSFVGVELDEQYLPITSGRLNHALAEETPAAAG